MNDAVILALAGLAGYTGVLHLAHRYAVSTGWQVPEQALASNWIRRRNVGAALGALAMIASAGCAAWLIAGWPMRALVVTQSVLLAAAGASDLHRFHLPLPLTMAGMAVAIASLSVFGVALPFVIFGLVWAVAIIAAHALLSKGSMQLGDHLATIWIALAIPVNGMLALLLGDAANVVYARAARLKAGKVAAAGAWLIFAAALTAAPPYFLWFNPLPGQPPALARPAATPAALSAQAQQAAWTRQALIQLAERASDETARVALADDRAGRVAAAAAASASVSILTQQATALQADSTTAVVLGELSQALADYDVDAVRGASLRLAEERARLTVQKDGG